MAVWIWKRLMALWRTAWAKVDEVIIAGALRATNVSGERENISTQRAGKHNAWHDGKIHQPRKDEHEP